MIKITPKMVRAATKVLIESGAFYSELRGDPDPSPELMRQIIKAALLESRDMRKMLRYWRRVIPFAPQ
jgi:hypothetical protein